jgi:hypothetical protein
MALTGRSLGACYSSKIWGSISGLFLNYCIKFRTQKITGNRDGFPVRGRESLGSAKSEALIGEV